MMGTQATPPTSKPLAQNTNYLNQPSSSLRSRLKKLSQDLEKASHQTLQLKSELKESERKNAVLKSIVNNLRTQSSVGSNKNIATVVTPVSTLESNAEPRETIEALKHQLSTLQSQRDQERKQSKAMEMELFEALEWVEKEFVSENKETRGDLKGKLACFLNASQLKLKEKQEENQELKHQLQQVLSVEKDLYKWEETVKSHYKDPTRIFNSHWVLDTVVSQCEATACSVNFGLFNRKHHCRCCGHIFCGKHSNQKMKLSVLEHKPDVNGLSVRVCSTCFEKNVQVSSVDRNGMFFG